MGDRERSVEGRAWLLFPLEDLKDGNTELNIYFSKFRFTPWSAGEPGYKFQLFLQRRKHYRRVCLDQLGHMALTPSLHLS